MKRTVSKFKEHLEADASPKIFFSFAHLSG